MLFLLCTELICAVSLKALPECNPVFSGFVEMANEFVGVTLLLLDGLLQLLAVVLYLLDDRESLVCALLLLHGVRGVIMPESAKSVSLKRLLSGRPLTMSKGPETIL